MENWVDRFFPNGYNDRMELLTNKEMLNELVKAVRNETIDEISDDMYGVVLDKVVLNKYKI